MLPATASVVAISPLSDERAIVALADLAARRSDLHIIEIALESVLPPAETELAALAQRLWVCRRRVVSDQLRDAGVGVEAWRPGDSLETTIRSLEATRRGAHRRRRSAR